MPISSIPQKRCTKCGELKPATNEHFHKDKHTTDGFTSHCKACRLAHKYHYDKYGASDKWKHKINAESRGVKYCAKCQRELPATSEYFANDITSNCGLRSYCKSCGNVDTRQYKTMHHETILDYARNYYWQNRNVVLFKRNEYNAINRDKVNAARIVYYWKNPEKSRLRSIKSYWKNPVESRAKGRAAAAKRRAAEGSYTPSDIRLQYKTQKGLCWWCGCELNPNKYHVDHRIALARGGTNWPNNICCTCPRCNLSKQDKLPYEWNGRLL